MDKLHLSIRTTQQNKLRDIINVLKWEVCNTFTVKLKANKKVKHEDNKGCRRDKFNSIDSWRPDSALKSFISHGKLCEACTKINFSIDWLINS